MLSSLILVVSGAKEISRDRGCIRTMNPDLGPSNIPDPDITMALGKNKATHRSPLLPSFHRTWTILSLSLPHTTAYIYIFAHHSSARLSGATRCQVGLCSLLRTLERLSQTVSCMWVSLSLSVCHGAGQDHASSSQKDHNSAQPPGTVFLESSPMPRLESPDCISLSPTCPSL